MRLPASLKWIGLALLGLLIATAVALAATGLISRQIGIDSESITAGDTLAPAFDQTGNRQGGKSRGEAESEKEAAPSHPAEGNSGQSVEAEPEPELGPEPEPLSEPESQIEPEPETQAESQTRTEAAEPGSDDGRGGGSERGEGPDD
jgi:hypothetical protein